MGLHDSYRPWIIQTMVESRTIVPLHIRPVAPSKETTASIGILAIETTVIGTAKKLHGVLATILLSHQSSMIGFSIVSGVDTYLTYTVSELCRLLTASGCREQLPDDAACHLPCGKDFSCHFQVFDQWTGIIAEGSTIVFLEQFRAVSHFKCQLIKATVKGSFERIFFGSHHRADSDISHQANYLPIEGVSPHDMGCQGVPVCSIINLVRVRVGAFTCQCSQIRIACNESLRLVVQQRYFIGSGSSANRSVIEVDRGHLHIFIFCAYNQLYFPLWNILIGSISYSRVEGERDITYIVIDGICPYVSIVHATQQIIGIVVVEYF